MKIEVKGHSGCQIDVVNEDNNVYVYKSTRDSKYLKRLVLQAEKQKAAAEVEYQHIRVPKIYEILQTGMDGKREGENVRESGTLVPSQTISNTQTSSPQVTIKMQYVYSKNFIEFFEQAGFEQIDYLIGALEYFIEHEIGKCKLENVSAKIFQDKFASIRKTCEANPLYQVEDKFTNSLILDEEIKGILDRSEQVFMDMGAPSNPSNSSNPSERFITIPVGLCHGDLTFSNILFNGNNYYLIDFLDSFVETPLQDIVKIRQDTAHRWSQLMYTKRYDAVRLHIVLDKIDREIDTYFSNKYQWYRDYYQVMQLMNILRILPYAKEAKVVEYLKKTLCGILDGIEGKRMYENVGDSDSLVPSRTISDNGEANPLVPQKHSLLVPVAADKPEYANGLPYVFGLDKDGVIICIKSIMGLDLNNFDNIYFTVLKKHDERFFIVDSLNLQFKRLGIKNAKVVVLDEPTRDQAETIFQTIMKEKIQGSIFIKDADCYFKTELNDENAVAIFPIEELEVLAPKDKSYVAVDDMYYLTNIIEKSVVGHYISAGGYSIKREETFLHYYHQLRGYGRLYLSHIIYAMLLDKKTFRPMMVDEYKDWGTKGDWSRSSEQL